MVVYTIYPKDDFIFGNYGSSEEYVKVDNWCVSGLKSTINGKFTFKSSIDMILPIEDELTCYNVCSPKFLKDYCEH